MTENVFVDGQKKNDHERGYVRRSDTEKGLGTKRGEKQRTRKDLVTTENRLLNENQDQENPLLVQSEEVKIRVNGRLFLPQKWM